MISLMAYT